MPIFGALTVTEARRLIKDNQRLMNELRDADRINAERVKELDAAKAALRDLEAAPPPTFQNVLTELKGFVPTLPFAPGYSVLATASDPKTFAQGLHMMLLHARHVGQVEGKAAR